MVGNIAEAEDLTQEAFLQLHRKIATFRGDSAFSTWLHRLAINVVLMQLRKKGLSLILSMKLWNRCPKRVLAAVSVHPTLPSAEPSIASLLNAPWPIYPPDTV